MVQTQPKPITFADFMADYPRDGGRYELIEGEVIDVRPRGKHELMGGFLTAQLILEIYRNNLPYEIPSTCVLKPDRPAAAYLPDLNGEYQLKLYRDQQILESVAFPHLRLRTDQIFTLQR